jgi:predicted  nucleic acid-binding Zn-ribbon protein
MNEEKPYLERVETIVVVHREYNHNYGDERVCQCGHVYYRHFDPYEEMSAVGCKYCGCSQFVEITNEQIAGQFVEAFKPLTMKEAKEPSYFTPYDGSADSIVAISDMVFRCRSELRDVIRHRLGDSEKLQNAFRKLTMQDVRLRVGEGRLRHVDVLAGINAELTARYGLIKPILDHLLV